MNVCDVSCDNVGANDLATVTSVVSLFDEKVLVVECSVRVAVDPDVGITVMIY